MEKVCKFNFLPYLYININAKQKTLWNHLFYSSRLFFFSFLLALFGSFQNQANIKKITEISVEKMRLLSNSKKDFTLDQSKQKTS